ncbi:hypothetical protein [Phormidium nigroviride]
MLNIPENRICKNPINPVIAAKPPKASFKLLLNFNILLRVNNNIEMIANKKAVGIVKSIELIDLTNKILAKLLSGKNLTWIKVEIKTIKLANKLNATIGKHQDSTNNNLNLLNITVLIILQ